MSLPPAPVLYRAPFVVPVASPVIPDGGVLVHAGRIVAVDRFARLRDGAREVVTVVEGMIVPALINCHTHLELSYFSGLATEEPGCSAAPADFTGWIRQVIAKRGIQVPPQVINEMGRAELERQCQRGVALVADVGNRLESKAIGAMGCCPVIFGHELIGVTEAAADSALASLADNDPCIAHAPYSCHSSLLRRAKARSRMAGTLFSIHVAESAEEVEFLRGGTGRFHDFLQERLGSTGALSKGRALADLVSIPGCGAVEYLDTLGILDALTLCVHVVHVSDGEIELLAQRKAKVCLCPGSNRKLGVGKAPLARLLARQLLPGLGTDSLASNDCLDLWREMQILQEDHPSVAPERIFAMATAGGAAALAAGDRLGTLEPGKEAALLAVEFAGSSTDVFPFLVETGLAHKVRWVEGGYGG